MDRTKKLLMSVTASALLSGNALGNGSLPEIRSGTTNSEITEPDYQADFVAQSEEVTLRKLRWIGADKPILLEEIFEKFTRPSDNYPYAPAVSRKAAQDMLTSLVRRGKIRRIGNGQDQPYRYYNPRAVEDRQFDLTRTAVIDVLYRVAVENALSVDEVLARRPDLDRRMIERVLEQLRMDGDIRRTGNNTASRPYRYYDRSRRGGFGG